MVKQSMVKQPKLTEFAGKDLKELQTFETEWRMYHNFLGPATPDEEAARI